MGAGTARERSNHDYIEQVAILQQVAGPLPIWPNVTRPVARDELLEFARLVNFPIDACASACLWRDDPTISGTNWYVTGYGYGTHG
jgi:hypothetical protein